ncbi:hypothetical protein DFH07DRAFT_956134 [Mycena maculata]|uniref:Uncharacterized protein n=1 Tax=Mycena maculata TaxID=230809 RepID=A0AAD7JIK2_9AGAR|nr:hypothetical protein DFH07DRAFT_956134 [Mycena maculata]
MDHPYSGTAGYIYANEHPYTPVDPQPKNPYSKLKSFVPSPSSIISNPIPTPNSHQRPQTSPRTSHDSSWSTEGTYTRTQRPKHADPSPARPRGLSQSQPLIPLRAPVAHPYQQQNSSWIDDTDVEADAAAPNAAPFVLPLGAAPPRGPKMTPYERDGDPLSLRRSAFVPYEPRPFERALEAERAARGKNTPWRIKIQPALEQRRIRRAIAASIQRLSRLMRFES